MKRMRLLMVLGLAVASCWATAGYDDLAKLVKSGVSEDIVLAYINASCTNFALTPDEIVQLKASGASSKVITAAIQHKKQAYDSVALKSESAPPREGAAVQTQTPPAGSADPGTVYEEVPPTGSWVLIGDYWYWQYPSGVVVDLGWQPYYHSHDHWHAYRHGGRRW